MKEILVIGCGSAGERHIRNLSSMGRDIKLYAYDQNYDRSKNMEKYGAIPVTYFPAAKVDAFVICTPPGEHLRYAKMALDRGGVDMFIEKPLSTDRIETINFIRHIQSLAVKPAILLGYNMRFYSEIVTIKELLASNTIGKIHSVRAEFGQHLKDWHPDEDYRSLYVGRKGCGIILDASHEIDYLRWLLGDVSSVSCFCDKLSDLDVETEDTAEILLRFESGVIGSVHLDFTQTEYTRGCKIVGENGSIGWVAGVGAYITKGSETTIFPDVTGERSYFTEMQHFIDCLERRDTPLTTEIDGVKALEIVNAALKSNAEGKVVRLS